MPDHKEQGSFSADIPADAVAEALEAVERSRSRPDGAATSGEAALPEAAPGEVERLRAELDLSQEGSRKLFEQLKAEHERLLRTAADLENYKKRAAREKDEVQRYGNERLVKELLPALDALDRALAAAPAGDALASGVSMTRRLLEEALSRFGVKGFSARGERFDPRLHEALMTVATADAAPGTVLEERQRGYFLHERLIRPAAVVVSAPPPAAPPAGAGEPASEGT